MRSGTRRRSKQRGRGVTVHPTDLFIQNQSSEATRRAYKYDLDKWFGWLGEDEESPETALKFRRWLEDNHQPRTAARVFNTCRSYYRWAMADSNPFQSLKSPRR